MLSEGEVMMPPPITNIPIPPFGLVNSHLLIGDGGCVLVDAGSGSERKVEVGETTRHLVLGQAVAVKTDSSAKVSIRNRSRESVHFALFDGAQIAETSMFRVVLSLWAHENKSRASKRLMKPVSRAVGQYPRQSLNNLT
ncbi:MAG: MBL fold metallo-hydrolase [Pseudomonadales bacterium]|nr:MBL fold metallo-hydrolase [Pseudomonadales bacterium]